MEPTSASTSIKKLLAEHLGIEPDDINDDDSFSQDLHMSPSDLTDFIHQLENSGFDAAAIDLTQIETFSDLIEALDLHE